jgi:hypothetical protein
LNSKLHLVWRLSLSVSLISDCLSVHLIGHAIFKSRWLNKQK